MKYNIFDFVFYKIYRFAQILKVRFPENTACILVGVLISLPTSELVRYLLKVKIISINLTKWNMLIIYIIIEIATFIYFYSGKRFLRIEEYYSNKSKKFKLVSNILFILFLIFYIVILMKIQ